MKFRFTRAVMYGGGKVSKVGLVDDVEESEVQVLLAGSAGEMLPEGSPPSTGSPTMTTTTNDAVVPRSSTTRTRRKK